MYGTILSKTVSAEQYFDNSSKTSSACIFVVDKCKPLKNIYTLNIKEYS